MIQLTPHMTIKVAVEPVDFRKGIDGLAAVCRQVMASDPFSGQVFVFRNKRQTAIKILLYDGQGFGLLQKRLSKGRFTWWPEREGSSVEKLAAHELQLLLWNGDPRFGRVAAQWRELAQR
jgi:transposase